MISIRVISLGQSAAAPLATRFDERGGTIGRASDNHLVLADGEQAISRVQARIVCRAGQYSIVDLGGNPIALNGQLLDGGREAPIRPGDELRIGEYVLSVEAAESAPSALPASSGIPLDWDPFADETEAADAAVAPAVSVPMVPPAVATLPPNPTRAPTATTPATTPSRVGPTAPHDAVLSWNLPGGESRTFIRSAVQPQPVASMPPSGGLAPATARASTMSIEPARQPPPGTPRPPSAVIVASLRPGTETVEMAELTSALREGLGLDELPVGAQSLTPALMRLLGSLVQEATRGTVELLVARAALKREIRAEVTVIAARENNPLKFSPSAEVALGHLLGPASRGFMEPQRAMQDAYDDLRAHQFGFLAGMRAALEGILRRFDPAELENKLTEKKTMLGALLPNKRKAQMWEVFTELYGQISSEASDDFHRLFGEEFVRAYNDYVDQLEGGR